MSFYRNELLFNQQKFTPPPQPPQPETTAFGWGIPDGEGGFIGWGVPDGKGGYIGWGVPA